MIPSGRPSARLAHTREAVERHREEFALVHAVSEAANESASLSSVLSEVTQMICEHMGWPIGHALGIGPDSPPTTHSLDVWYLEDPQVYGPFRGATEAAMDAMISRGALGRLFAKLAPYSIDDIGNCSDFVRRDAARQLGLHHYHAIPILSGTEVVAALEFLATGPTKQTPERLQALLADIGAALGRVADRELRERQRLALIRAELAREEAVQRATELQRLAAELRRRNRELDQFAYVASHDLRAPLRGIANLAGWLAEDLDPHLTNDARRYLELLKGRVNRMESLISGLLEFSRVGRRATPDELIDVHAMVREIADLLGAESRVDWHIEPLPQVRGPRILLRQVFHNLLSNAVKYAVDQHPKVEVGATRGPDGTWRFFVRDYGPGIAPCYQARIWEIFQTLQPRDDVESTGIGLSLVRKIVEQRGGEVGIESAPGAGACFSFTWLEHGPNHGLGPRERC
jgi:signal transduction histidine kinase